MKKTIRRLMRAKNLSIDCAQRENYANEIFKAIEESEIFKSAATIALYCALPDEIPTEKIIERWRDKKRILLPRVGENFYMEFYEYDHSHMESGAYGIFEPQGERIVAESQIDMIIVPGVAFTPSGARLGRGKGYYDRFLSRDKTRAYTIGICYKHQLVESLPVEPHDVMLNRVIAPL